MAEELSWIKNTEDSLQDELRRAQAALGYTLLALDKIADSLHSLAHDGMESAANTPDAFVRHFAMGEAKGRMDAGHTIAHLYNRLQQLAYE